MTATDAPPVPSSAQPTRSYTVRGERVRIPVEVRSATMVQATYFVPATAAQKMIEYSGLQVVRTARTLAVVSLAAVQYADSDLGPYNEVAVAVVVHPHDGRPAGSPMSGQVSAFIHRLPVNQVFTCAAGRDIWGFPKWVADITYVERNGCTDVVLMDQDQLILSLAVRHSPIPTPAQEMAMTCYSFREGVLAMTPWTTRNSRVHARPGGAALELGSEHPMAAELRTLRLPKRALVSMSVGHLEATFEAPVAVS